MGGSSEPAARNFGDRRPPVEADPAATAAAPTDPAPADGGPGARAGTAPCRPSPCGVGSDFKAGPGLPKDVVNAYKRGDAVVLLIVNNGRDRRSAS